MIEYTIAEVLATACSLTLGSDIWGGPLPSTESTGVGMAVFDEADTRLGVVGKAYLHIYVVKDNYYDGRALAKLIADKLNDQVALDDWMASEVRTSYKGTNLMNNHLFVVYSVIRKE
jgi:hypothetical protein